MGRESLLAESVRDSKSLPAFLCNAIVNPAATMAFSELL
jgi:hypothetical protein